MMLIECFSDAHIDNLEACLRLSPDKMILIGNADQMRVPAKRYQKLTQRRGQRTQISLCDVQNRDLNDMYRIIRNIIPTDEECVIDMTGGDELVIMAIGAVLTELDLTSLKNIRVERYDHGSNAVLDCFHGNLSPSRKLPLLSIEELILVHGGKICADAYQPPMDCNIQDVDRLWHFVCEDPKTWNSSLINLNEVESYSESKMSISLSTEYLRTKIRNYDQKETAVRTLLERLHALGVVDNQSHGEALKYTYNSSVMRYCMEKAGNILEIKTLLEGRAVRENGAPIFTDCRMSVSIDWDGVIHPPKERVPETRNEIDVVLMHGTTPLFISCKNGNIEEEELYKLHTVATRFGGSYVKKMLIATDLDRKPPAGKRAFMQRAWDMDILLVTDAADLTKNEWRQLFEQAIR